MYVACMLEALFELHMFVLHMFELHVVVLHVFELHVVVLHVFEFLFMACQA